MSENQIVPFKNNDGTPGDNAVLLLAATEALGLDAAVVRTTQDGFSAPAEVVEKAFGKAKAKQMVDSGEKPEAKAETKPAKKSAAKKAAKKAPAKKSAKKG